MCTAILHIVYKFHQGYGCETVASCEWCISIYSSYSQVGRPTCNQGPRWGQQKWLLWWKGCPWMIPKVYQGDWSAGLCCQSYTGSRLMSGNWTCHNYVFLWTFFNFLYIFLNFLLYFPLLTYSQSFTPISAHYLRHSRWRISKNLIQLILEQSKYHFTTQESLKILKPTIGSNGRPVLVPTLELSIHNLHVPLHLNHRTILHPVYAQSSQEGISPNLRQTNPQVDHKSRDPALHQATRQAPLPGGPVQITQLSQKELPHLPWEERCWLLPVRS